jgi:hypothetical protein
MATNKPPIIQYTHHGVEVWVREDLKGQHLKHSLCYQCSRFHPGSTLNCRLAGLLQAVSRLLHVAIPVYECPIFHNRQVH